MTKTIVKIGGAAVLAALLGGWTTIYGPVTRTHCGVGYHDVANLNAINPRHAYWCKSDNDGYLGEEHWGHVPPPYLAK
jgi:hypothetical protein